MVGRLRNSLNSTRTTRQFLDQFGRSVSLHGDTALIGAWKDDDNSKQDSGSVYVFKAPPPPPLAAAFFAALAAAIIPHVSRGIRDVQPKLYASDPADNDYFGISVSLYGDTALIGATGDDDT